MGSGDYHEKITQNNDVLLTLPFILSTLTKELTERAKLTLANMEVISSNVAVQDSAGKEIKSQLLPVVNASMVLRKYAAANVGKTPTMDPLYWLAFTATVPPLGFSTYFITSDKSRAASSVGKDYIRESHNNAIEVGPGTLKLIFNASEGKLIQYVNSKNSVRASLEQSFTYYSGDDGSTDLVNFQASGAYIFLPNVTYPIKPEGKVPLTVLRGPLFDEVHQKINSWIYQITRVYKDKDHAEVEFTVGPIPIDDGYGKELVTQIKTSIKSGGTFYTDSNGRDFLKRTRDYRADWDLQINQPVAGNYYPINLGMFTKDDTTELSVLVDRSVGGSSLVDGELELMLHRRLLKDDGRGVAEALNETVCISNECTGLTIQGKYYIRIDPVGEGAKWRRSYGQEIYSPFLLAFSQQDAGKRKNFQVPTSTAMDPSYVLPDNVALITLQELKDGNVLLRLAHLYEVGEDKDLSVMADVELKRLFPDKKINKIKEVSLSANQGREEMEKKRLVWKVQDPNVGQESVSRGGPVDPFQLVVKLAPMEIRTFLIDLDDKKVTNTR